MSFPSPSFGASGGDLAIQISPLGLVEVSDEEFEVHGPRMMRYSQAAAFYLGHHWQYKKAAGEPQLVINFVRALSDWMTNFVFGHGITYKTAKEYQHIVPALLDRLFTIDNHGDRFYWEVGNIGSIFGDCFIKVAYEEAYTDPAGNYHPGRVRFLPLFPGHCFPRWHPHDPERLEEFKHKYRFWSTAPDGTRIVNTYVEIITDDEIREYVNDQLVSQRPNFMGEIPIVHIANAPAAGSPWGLSDVWEVIPLNREYNEKATDISDIINYHAAPVTIITGGKPPNMEKGPSKVWGLANDKAKVFNLEGGHQGLPHAVEYLDQLKTRMHELSGIPVTALGQEQAISDTAGVALAIAYMPATQKANLKKITYGHGLRRLCRFGLRTLFMKEPWTVNYDPTTSGIIQEGQAPSVNPMDPGLYDIDPVWAPFLPVDSTVILDAIQRKMELGLESKVGALRELGEEFPDEKLAELAEEQKQDAIDAGAKRLINAQVDAIIMETTGTIPETSEPMPAPETSGEGEPAPQPMPVTNAIPTAIQQQVMGESNALMAEVVTRAVAPRVPSRRNVDKNSNELPT